MNVIEALQWRYATKKFDVSRKIPQEKIEVITQAFNLTATSYGLQPVKLIVIQDPELQQKLVSHAMNQAQVATASHLLVLCIQKELPPTFVHDYFDKVKKIRETPEEILAPFRSSLAQRFKEQHQDQARAWAVNQAYLAMGNLMTVCALEHVDACPMEGFEPKKFDQQLNLGDHGLTAVLIMPIGYRAEDDMFSELKKVRRPRSETVIHLKSQE